MYQSAKRIEFLDSVRGVAALFVLMSHTLAFLNWSMSIQWIFWVPFFSILFSGKQAVCMFFVLSGYILSRPFIKNEGDPAPKKINIITFYIRRFIRIWPPWFAVFLASIVAKKYFFSPEKTQPEMTDWIKMFWQHSLVFKDYLKQCLFLEHDSTKQLLNQDWSLGIELKGSILIPLFILMRKRYFAYFAMAGAVFFLNTGPRYISFMIGVMLASNLDFLIGKVNCMKLVQRVFLLIIGLVLYQAHDFFANMLPNEVLVQKLAWVLSSFGCAVLLVLIFCSKSAQSFLNLKIMTFIGKISFSLYLVQFIVILCILPRIVLFANNHGVVNEYAILTVIVFASILFSALLACVNYYLVEVPSVWFGHKISSAIQQRQKYF